MRESIISSKPSSMKRWVLSALAVIVVAVSVQYAFKTSENRSAFMRWKTQLQDFGQGVDIYERYTYPNAPIMALILYPLTFLPEITLYKLDVDLGALTWFYLKVAMTVLAFLWTFRLIEDPARPFPNWAKLATILLSIRPIVGDLSHGNVNLLIMFLIVAMLYAFRSGKDIWAGLSLALAVTCKVTPALFIPYFIWKRAWKTLAASAVGLVLFFFIIPSTFLGPTRNWDLLNGWMDAMIVPYMSGDQITTEHNNQSLNGLFYRLLTNNPSFEERRNGTNEYHNVVDWDPAVARGLLKAFGVAFLILMAWSCRTPTQPHNSEAAAQARKNWLLSAEYSLIILGMLLFSERTWKHHCVVLLIPFGVLCYFLAVQCPKRKWRNAVVVGLAVTMLLMTTTNTTLWEPFGYKMGAKLAQVYGGFTWALLLLLGLTAVVLRKGSKGVSKGSTGVTPVSGTGVSPVQADRKTIPYDARMGRVA